MTFLLKLLLPLAVISGLNAQIETFYADSTVETSQGNLVLEESKTYRVVITGTWSKWEDQNACGGTPENEIFFPSEDVNNGKAYMDASFIFAYPVKSSLCSEDNPKLPVSSYLRYRNGDAWENLVPSLDKYRPDHTYEYLVDGHNQTLQIRLPDSILGDNYGQLKVQIYESPTLGITYHTHESLRLDFLGILQSSEDGVHWTDLSPQPESPYLISAEESRPFLRSRKP